MSKGGSGGGGGSVIKVVEEVIKEKPEDPRITAINSYKLIARSVMAKSPKGKKSVKVYWVDKNGKKLDFDGVEVYRSIDRNEGFTTKPIFVTKNDVYYNTGIKKGMKYYYKVRGFKMIDGKKYYTMWSLKAWRYIR